jgi:hypothetical protein
MIGVRFFSAQSMFFIWGGWDLVQTAGCLIYRRFTVLYSTTCTKVHTVIQYCTVRYSIVYTTFCSRFLGEGISSLFEPRSGVLATVCKVQSKGQNHNTETCECLAHSK